MKPAVYDFEHYKGDTFLEIPMQYKVDGVAVNITDYEINMQLRGNYGQAIAYNMQIEITNAVNGQFKIKEQVIDIEAFKYLYDLQFKASDTDIQTYLKGTFEIHNDVTRIR